MRGSHDDVQQGTDERQSCFRSVLFYNQTQDANVLTIAVLAGVHKDCETALGFVYFVYEPFFLKALTEFISRQLM